MCAAVAERVLGGMRRAAFRGGLFLQTERRMNSVRSLALTSQMSAQSKTPTDEEQVNSEPIKFTTSKASHRSWKVDCSMGSQYERPWWKVLPISIVATGFLLWCALREETDIDAQLEKQLYEHLPGLLSDEEEVQIQSKPTS